MGWFYGWSERRELVAELTRPIQNDAGIKQECLGKAFSGNNLWCVFEQSGGERPARRFITVFLIRRGGPNDWGYKPVDECMGPYESSCPLKFLEMVPWDGSDNARDFRERVRAYWKARKARQVARKLGRYCVPT